MYESDHVYIHREPLFTVSSETGEVTSIVLEDGDVIRKKSQFDREEICINRGRAFVKLFPDTADMLCRRLSATGLYMCFAVLPYISRDSGILKKRNGGSVDIGYLCRQTGRSDKTIRRGMGELLEKGILAKAMVKRRQVYIANPYVFQNGVKANATLLQLFDRSEFRKI